MIPFVIVVNLSCALNVARLSEKIDQAVQVALRPVKARKEP